MKTYSIVGLNHQKSEELVASLQPGEPVMLVREPDNPFDPLAVSVWIKGKRVGYVPKAQNAVLARYIDEEGLAFEPPDMALDSASAGRASILAKFVRSPNSGFPMVEV